MTERLKQLNLGIVAHVDAGKTTLTERLLYAAGVIDAVGSVDRGTTQTDSLALERQRGITIKAAVVSFTVDDVHVNLIDTPGHPDFIAEVERALGVLDGAVLVISAVEGVQPQTRILMRALQRLQLPALLFVNKMDRLGADKDRVMRAISHRLGLGVEQPVFFGSARTGEGIERLMSGIARLLPSAEADADAPVSATVFKIERGARSQKLAYVRMFAGTVRTRDRLPFQRGHEEKVTAIDVFERGSAQRRTSVSAGEIAKLSGLVDVRIGDRIGDRTGPCPTGAPSRQFDPPALEAVVIPGQPGDGARLRVALAQLAEQDPLINVRQNDVRHEISVSLYGEVQKEVLQQTLAQDFGLEVAFGTTTTICIERPRRTGHALELLQSDDHPFSATIGLRVEPAPAGSGVEFRLDTEARRIPLHIYKTADAFRDAMTQYVRETLKAGPNGWEVTDCSVTMDACAYYTGDGPQKPTRPTPKATAADFRKLTPIVLMRALARAGTVVCQPVMDVSLEVPADTVGAVLALVGRLGGSIKSQFRRAELAVIETSVPAAQEQDLRRQLPELTSGEGVIEASFGGYQPITAVLPGSIRGNESARAH
jgi:ribosomal protection tetracycline resistance protein